MKPLKMLGACSLALFALSVVASPASGALPEFSKSGICEQTGQLIWLYTNSTCTTDSATTTGEFAKSPFFSESGASTLETASGVQVACNKDIGQGEATGPKAISQFTIKFKECSSSGHACGSSGTITTNHLQGTMGYISKAAKEVGLDLASEAAGGLLMEFSCEGGVANVKVRGSVIGKATPVNTPTSMYSVTFALTKKGKQNITKLEGEAEDVLETSKEGGAFEGSALETTDTVFPLAEVEIKA
jgi:hypothetical protein